MAARIIDLADAAAAAIEAAWSPVAPDAVTREYAPDVVTNPDDPAVVTGRRVYVLPAGYGDEGFATRAELDKRYTLSVMVVERYADGPGPVPTAWVDERVAFVEEMVWRVLRDPALTLLDGDVIPATEDTAEVTAVYDFAELPEKLLFVSVARFTFMEIAAN